MELHYLPGSPYARIARVLALEFGLDCAFVEDSGFPPQRAETLNPAKQVPTLVDGGRTVFGTRLICEYLLDAYRQASPQSEPPVLFAPADRQARWDAAQVLVALETALASAVTRAYLIWTGAEHRPDAAIPLDLAARELERTLSLLDWLEKAALRKGFLPGALSLHDIWLTCFIEWTEARIAIPWRGRPKLEAIVAHTGARESLSRTAPGPSPL